ncbi:MAG: hypothetical protein ACOYBX_01285 [Mycobacterium sp.]
MRRRRSKLLSAAFATLAVLLLGASSAQVSSRFFGSREAPVSLAAARPPAPSSTPAPAAVPGINFDALAAKATAAAQVNGADISLALMDRQTGRVVLSGDQAPFPLASVAKLFIADDLLIQSAQRKQPLSPADQHALESMLRASDDLAADDFWVRDGGNAIINRVAARYKLASTKVPYDGNWWNTMSTTADLVRYYAMLLDGSGGLPRPQADMILANLAASSPLGADGYPQRFGIPDGLFAEPVAVKQGWMCCWNGPNWLHLSTGVIGADRRYVIAVGSMQPVDDATARNTVTQAVKTMFPLGRI